MFVLMGLWVVLVMRGVEVDGGAEPTREAEVDVEDEQHDEGDEEVFRIAEVGRGVGCGLDEGFPSHERGGIGEGVEQGWEGELEHIQSVLLVESSGE
jgi:hypothetical protein